MSDLTDAQAEMLARIVQPKRVRGDSGEMERHNPKDLLAIIKYLHGKTAMEGDGGGVLPGVRFGKAVPPGAV